LAEEFAKALSVTSTPVGMARTLAARVHVVQIKVTIYERACRCSLLVTKLDCKPQEHR
jgi:hypothetical protein